MSDNRQNPAAAMDRMLARVDRLHTSPHVACQVVTLLQDDDFEIRELVRCLEADPALASSVLKLVNSSYFGMTRNVASLQQAVTLLGSRSLRLAVLNFGLLKHLVQDTPAQVYHSFWQRALTMASAASLISRRTKQVKDNEAYSAGLLAEIGVLVLTQVESEQYPTMYEKLGHSYDLVQAERQLYGFDHAELGAHLLTQWYLPESLTEAVAHHHGQIRDAGTGPSHGDQGWSSPASQDLMSVIVYTASCLADCLWTPGTPATFATRKLLETEFQIDLDGFIQLAMDCKQSIAENAQLYRVQITDTIDCDAIVENARRRYLDAAMEAALDCDSMSSIAGGD